MTKDLVINNKSMYGNYKVYHPKGHLMFYCDKKKYNWYLSRNLAIILEGEEKSIKLTFEPKGDGEKSHFLTERRENICVVTGSTDDLTKHHVVPTQYRQHLPDVYKSKNSNDVVVMRNKEHSEYERIADIYKAELINIYVTDEEIEYNKMLLHIRKIASTLDRHESSIPSERVADLYNRLNTFLDKLGIIMEEFSELEIINLNKLIVERMGVENLILSWKKHFIKYADPQFLPKWWDVNYIKIIDIRN